MSYISTKYDIISKALSNNKKGTVFRGAEIELKVT